MTTSTSSSTNPKGFVPGTAMGFAGIQKDSERADVIAYLHTLSDNPVPLADGGEITRNVCGRCVPPTAGSTPAWPFAVPILVQQSSPARIVIGAFRRTEGCYHEEKATLIGRNLALYCGSE